MDAQPEFNAFVSYSHSDLDWVSGFLIPHLEASGLSLCVDFKNFILGLPAIENMSRAVENSRKVILVLSPAWISSEWTSYESLLSQTLDPAALRQRTIPLMFIDCALPLRLRFLTYADFREPRLRESEMKRLIAALLT